uniref:Uncharacterized protein n=1 Tax=Glossina pallidipes TaxID=7398 RepID=A0A1B0AFY3_GLOPL
MCVYICVPDWNKLTSYVAIHGCGKQFLVCLSHCRAQAAYRTSVITPLRHHDNVTCVQVVKEHRLMISKSSPLARESKFSLKDIMDYRNVNHNFGQVYSNIDSSVVD